jgi:hypothetical protein
MKVETFKGYNDTQAVRVQGELTLEDFIIHEEAVTQSDWNGKMSASISIKLKDEVREEIYGALPKSKSYNYSTKQDEINVTDSWSRYFSSEVKYNGCRTEDQKKKKAEKVRQDLVVEIADSKAEVYEQLVKEANDRIRNHAESMTDAYNREVREVMDGSRMNSEFTQKHLDDPDLDKELKELNDQIKEIQAKQDTLRALKRQKRNEKLLAYLDANGWNDDEKEDGDNKIKYTPEIQEELREMYKKGEAFKNLAESSPFGF